MITTGSVALNQYFTLDRPARDIDYISTELEFKKYLDLNCMHITEKKDTKFGTYVLSDNKKPVEFEIVERNKSTKMLWDRYKDYDILPIEALLAMKLSHRYLKNSSHFLKTMRDIQVMRLHGVELDDFLQDWLKIREKETYNYNHPSLDQKKVDFFVDEFYKYDHDDIHEAIKIGVRPAYQFIKIPGEDVKCSKELFDALTEENQLLCTYEEACVLALERHQIPNDFGPNPRRSFEIALMKVCTSITSGWFREFSWENYYKVLDYYKKRGYSNYVDLFKEALSDGRVKNWDEVKASLVA